MMRGFIKIIARAFNTKIKFVFDAHSARIFVNRQQVSTELLFDIEAAIKDFQRFNTNFQKECQRIKSAYLGGFVLAKPLLILEVNWDLAQSREFQDMLIERSQSVDFNPYFRQICFKINGKLFLFSGKVLKEVPSSYKEWFDG